MESASKAATATHGRPLRIVSLLSAGTEIVCGLGLADQLVAVSHESDYPAAIIGKPRVTRSNIEAAGSREIDTCVRDMVAAGRPLYEIDTAAIVDLAPDLIVTQAQCDVCAVRYEDVMALVAREPKLAATRVVALNPLTLEGIFADIARVAEGADCPQRGAHYIARLRERVAAVRARTEHLPASDRPRIAAIEWIDPLMLAAHWMPELIAIAGGEQPLTTGGEHSVYNPWEEVIAYDPQVVLVMPCGFDVARATQEAAHLGSAPGWSTITAVRDGRVYAIDGNTYFNRSGPRIVDSLELLAALVHPELFGPAAEMSDDRRAWAMLSLP